MTTWQLEDGRMQCSQCGYISKRATDKMPIHDCRAICQMVSDRRKSLRDILRGLTAELGLTPYIATLSTGIRFGKAILFSYRHTVNGGPGTALAALLSIVGPYSAGGCQDCKSRIAEMDAQGPAWCSDNICMIAGWLQEAANKRNLPFSSVAARYLVRRAIAIGRPSRRP